MGIMNKFADFIKLGNDVDEDEYEDYEDDDYVEPEPEKDIEEKRMKQPEKKPEVARRRINPSDTSVCVFKPKDFDEAREIVDELLSNKTVLMNFENVDITVSQRVLDVVTGACIAISGNLQKISNYIFIATPASVDVSGEFQGSLTGIFDGI